MEKYRYTLDNSIIEVKTIEEVPEGLSYETIIEDNTLTESQLKEIAIAEIKAKYEFHRLNGWNAYQDFRAMIVLDIASGEITEQQAFLIEKDLKIGYDRIAQNGDWMTAHYELSQITVSYPFIQSYLDIALNYIANYIQNNYDN